MNAPIRIHRLQNDLRLAGAEATAGRRTVDAAVARLGPALEAACPVALAGTGLDPGAVVAVRHIELRLRLVGEDIEPRRVAAAWAHGIAGELARQITGLLARGGGAEADVAAFPDRLTAELEHLVGLARGERAWWWPLLSEGGHDPPTPHQILARWIAEAPARAATAVCTLAAGSPGGWTSLLAEEEATVLAAALLATRQARALEVHDRPPLALPEPTPRAPAGRIPPAMMETLGRCPGPGTKRLLGLCLLMRHAPPLSPGSVEALDGLVADIVKAIAAGTTPEIIWPGDETTPEAGTDRASAHHGANAGDAKTPDTGERPAPPAEGRAGIEPEEPGSEEVPGTPFASLDAPATVGRTDSSRSPGECAPTRVSAPSPVPGQPPSAAPPPGGEPPGRQAQPDVPGSASPPGTGTQDRAPAPDRSDTVPDRGPVPGTRTGSTDRGAAAPSATPEERYREDAIQVPVDCGGLWFLIRPLLELPLVSARAGEALEARLLALGWLVLQRVLTPLPKAEREAAVHRQRHLVQVFAGLETPPRELRKPADPAALAGAAGALDALCEAIPEDVAPAPRGWQLLPGPEPFPAGHADRALAAVVLRPGRVRITPDRADLVLPLESVDLALRRSGWDIDPGWVPHLGRAIHFHYEEQRR